VTWSELSRKRRANWPAAVSWPVLCSALQCSLRLLRAGLHLDLGPQLLSRVASERDHELAQTQPRTALSLGPGGQLSAGANEQDGSVLFVANASKCAQVGQNALGGNLLGPRTALSSPPSTSA